MDFLEEEGIYMLDYNIINQIKENALDNNIPIMMDDGIKFLKKYIRDHNIKNILEIGTAVGYSAIMMCDVSDDIFVTTIERDEKRYLEAISNLKKVGLEDRIKLIYNDAFNVNLKEKFDLIFIDAAKAQNINFFEKFQYNLKKGGTIITDNMNFHDFLNNNSDFSTEFLDVGDGLAISRFNEV